MQKRTILSFVIALFPLIALAQPTGPMTYAVIEDDSALRFTVSKWTAFTVEGQFHDFRGTVTYDHDDPTQSHLSFEADIASIDTQRDARDKTLQGRDFFHARKHPKMTFESTAIIAADATLLQVTGNLTIRGVTHKITAPVEIKGFSTIPGTGDLAGFATTFTLDRTDYGVLGQRWSKGEHIIGHEVTVHLTVSALHR